MKTTDQLEPTVFVIFGGAGDLTWRKLVPALFDLSQDRSMPAHFSIITVDRVVLSDEKLRRRLHDGVKKFSRQGMVKAAEWREFARHIRYQQGDFKKLQTYTALGEECAKLEKEWGARAHRIFYMATPPSMFGEIPKYLGRAGLARDREWARIVVEKPIGYNLESARALNAILAANFEESQIFRIDHYLGKETVQNILAFRFANPLFEPLWNRRYVDCVTITAVEAVGVEHRGGYYEHAGALRDMVQNHLMQLLCLVAMEPMRSATRRWMFSTRCVPFTGTPSINASCGANTARDGSAARKFPAIARKTECRRIPKPRRLWRSGSSLITGAGRGCLSTCAPGSGWPGRPRKLRSNFAACRISPFRLSPLWIGSRPGW